MNLATGTLTVRESKTIAGEGRRVDLPLALREELTDHKARGGRTRPTDPVFPNRDGRRQTVSNTERRLKTVIRHANRRLAELGVEAIDEEATPHSLRRLYASLRYALRDDAVYVAAQMGHADGGGLSMSTYARAVKRRERLTGAALTEFDRALEWAQLDVIDQARSVPALDPATAGRQETALQGRTLPPGPDSSAG